MEQRKSFTAALLAIIVVAILLGSGTGYLLSMKVMGKSSGVRVATGGTTNNGTSSVNVGDAFGSPDESTFKDNTEGVLLPGGVNGEGSYHLVKEGGESQNVYLTSSVLDLSLFENHRVKVWGETFRGQKAGWLMDVGRLQVLELNAPLPDWAKKAMEKAEQQSGQN